VASLYVVYRLRDQPIEHALSRVHFWILWLPAMAMFVVATVLFGLSMATSSLRTVRLIGA
jgi:hypothetical protein